MNGDSLGPVPLLTRWGLTPAADLVFRTLTMHGPQSAPVLARDLGLNEVRVQAALAELHDASAARPSVQTGGTERRWCAERIDRVLACLPRRRRPPARVPGPPTGTAVETITLGEGVCYLRSREATRHRLSQLVTVARHSHITMNPELTFDEASLQAAAPMDRKLQARGVKIRVLGVTKGDGNLLCPYGGQPKEPVLMYRQADSAPMKLIVIDSRVALFPVDPHNHERGYLEVSQTPIVESLSESFERHWAAAHDLSETALPTFELSPREEAVIALLSLGHTDVMVARELRLSERSISTIVRSIMDRLAVTNRFQLGVALGTLRAAPLPPGLSVADTAKKPSENPNPPENGES